MQRNLKTPWFATAASLVAFASAAFANTEDAQVRHLENRVTALEQQRGANGIINPPARPQVVEGADLFVKADVLYWQAHEDGLPLYIKNEGQGTDLSNGDVKGFDWDYDWGVRVGIGYNLAHDGWDVFLNWMRVYGRADKHGSTDDNAFWPTLIDPAAELNGTLFGESYYTKFHGRWKVQLDQIDLELGREFFVSKWLTLRPHFGLRTDWIRQRMNLHYNRFEGNPGQDYEIDAHDHFWGLGIAAGLDTQWSVGGGWSFFGNAAFAMLYGFHEIDREDELSKNVESTFVDMDDSYRISRAIGDLQLGLRWDTSLDNERLHFGIQAAWEHHVYLGQNQFPRFVDATAQGNIVGNQGDLTFQGWTLSARLDF